MNEKKCPHLKHITPEYRAMMSNVRNVSELELEALGLLAHECVDCGEDIRHLVLLKEGI